MFTIIIVNFVVTDIDMYKTDIITFSLNAFVIFTFEAIFASFLKSSKTVIYILREWLFSYSKNRKKVVLVLSHDKRIKKHSKLVINNIKFFQGNLC